MIPYLEQMLPGLTNKLMLVAKNPSKPHFNHYLFETLSLSIKICCKSNRAAVVPFEEAYFPVFQQILCQDVQEFVPYVFQIMSLLLELHEGEASVPEDYMILFPNLLVPLLWERPANIHPLVRLLQAFIQTGSQQVLIILYRCGVIIHRFHPYAFFFNCILYLICIVELNSLLFIMTRLWLRKN